MHDLRYILSRLFHLFDLHSNPCKCITVLVPLILEIKDKYEFGKLWMATISTSLLITSNKERKVWVRVSNLFVGIVPNLIDPPDGCRFHPRCPDRIDICDNEKPRLSIVGKNHYIACHVHGTEDFVYDK